MWVFVLYISPLAIEKQMPFSVVCIKNEVIIFLQEDKNFHVQFHNEEFDVMLAHMADVFDHFQRLNCLCKAVIWKSTRLKTSWLGRLLE